jgi:hypothetical protein
LDDWFADFADLLELQNLHNEPMIYYWLNLIFSKKTQYKLV